MLALRDVAVRFGARWAVRDLSLDVQDGEVVALVGDNGAGKSTALAVAAGVIDPDRGAVLLDGAPLRRARRAVGYVPEAADPPDHLRVSEVVRLAAALRGVAVDAALVELLVPPRIRDARVASLSLGERRRTCLCAALLGPPRALVLDEPDNGLDLAGTDLLVERIAAHAAGGGCALIVSHDVGFLDRLGARRHRLIAPDGASR